MDNYNIMISGIIPRPIGFVSTVSADGKSTNLAPFSYTQMVNYDPPVIVIGFVGGSGVWTSQKYIKKYSRNKTMYRQHDQRGHG